MQEDGILHSHGHENFQILQASVEFSHLNYHQFDGQET
jgi:hypothetical protein